MAVATPWFTHIFTLKIATTLLAKQAVVGHNVHLPCELPNLPDSPSLILWYKDQDLKPFYSYDAREMKAGQHKVHDQFNLGGRTNFTYATVPYATKVVLGHLLVTNLTTKDEGNFTCRVDFQKAQTAMSLLELKVLEPIWRLAIVDAHEREVGKETGPYLESERLYLTCRAYGGNPPAVVEWLSGDEIIASSSSGRGRHIQGRTSLWSNDVSRTKMNVVESVLQFPVLRREDQGREFTCRANNSNLTPVRTNIVSINMSLRPLHVEIEGPTDPLWSGKEVEFLCRSKGSRPPAKLKWGPEQILKILNYQTSLDMNMTVSRVKLIPSPDDDGRNINCTATNPSVPQYTISTIKKLVVHYSPQVEASLASFLTASSIKEGDDVYFECNVKANPPPRLLIWLHEDEEISENRSRGLFVQGQNLVLQKVSRLSRGKYQCKVTNAIATVTSEPVVLDVMFIPECVEPRNTTVSVSSSEEVRLNCSVESYPQPVEFLWRLNGTNGWESIDPSKISSDGSWSTLLYSSPHVRRFSSTSNPGSPMSGAHKDVILRQHSGTSSAAASLQAPSSNDATFGVITDPMTPFASQNGIGVAAVGTHRANKKRFKFGRTFAPGDSYGVVYCLARNEVGRQREPCIFNISPAGPPEDLVSCTLGNQSATTLAVSCIPGHDGGLQQAFIAKVLDEESRRVVANITSNVAKFYATGLAPGKDYLVMVTAVNPKGTSRPYILEGFALKVAENKINEYTNQTRSPLLGLFVGIVAGFVLVLGVLLLVTRARCRRRMNKRERSPAKHITEGDQDPLAPCSTASIAGDIQDVPNEDGSDERDACLKPPDLTAQTIGSVGSIEMTEREKHDVRQTFSPSKEVTVNEHLIPGGSTPPPLLGLSNTYGGGGGLPRAGSNYGFGVGRDSVSHTLQTSTLPKNRKQPPTNQQPLHSVDLPRVTSNAKQYYTLKINCTRQSNESFV